MKPACHDCGAPSMFRAPGLDGDKDTWLCRKCLTISMHTPECMAANEAASNEYDAEVEMDEHLRSGGRLQ